MNLIYLGILTFFAISLILGLFFGGNALLLGDQGSQMLIHILTSFLAIAFLASANVQSLLMLWQNQQLKKHKNSVLLRFLPPLQSMERLLFTLLIAGVLFLAYALGSGFYLHNGFLAVSTQAKAVLGLCAFFLLTLLLIGRAAFGWRGKTAFNLTLGGTLFALLSYFGTKALLL